MALQVSRLNNRIVLIIGIVCAAAAFVGVLLLVRNGGGPTTQVVVAKLAGDQGKLSAGTTLTSDMLTTIALPSDHLPSGSYTDPGALAGKILAVNVSANAPITAGQLASAGQAVTAATTLAGTSLVIDKGDVALAIPSSGSAQGGMTGVSSDLVSVGNFIQQGDRIDMLVDPGNGTLRYAFQDVLVLRSGVSGGAQGANASVFVVELPRNQAEQLGWLVTHSAPGQPAIAKYVLRPRDEYGTGYKDANPGTPVPNKNDQGASDKTLNALFPH